MSEFINFIYNNTALKNIAFLVSEKGIRFILISIGNIVVARSLGPTNFGYYNYILSLTAILFSLSTLGMDQILVKYFSTHNSNYSLIRSAVGIRLLITLPVSIFMGIIYLFSFDEVYLYLLIASLFYVFASFDVLTLFFISRNSAKKSSIPSTLSAAIATIGKVITAVFSSNLVLLFLITSFEKFLLTIFLFWNFRSSISKTLISNFSSKSELISLLKESAPLILSGVAVTLYMRVDQVLVRNMLSDTDVGLYSVGVKISELWYFVPTAAIAAYFPTMIRKLKRDKKEFFKSLTQITLLNISLALVAAIFLSFFGKWVISILYGSEFIGASRVLQIYSWSAIFVVIGLSISHWLLMEKLQIVTLYATVFGLMINLILNYFLIPLYGISGAAFASLVSYAFSSLIYYLIHPLSRSIILKNITKFK